MAHRPFAHSTGLCSASLSNAPVQHLRQMPPFNTSIKHLRSTSPSNTSIQHSKCPWHQIFLSKPPPFCAFVRHLSHSTYLFSVLGHSVQPLHSTPIGSLRAHRRFAFLAPATYLKATRRDASTNAWTALSITSNSPSPQACG